MNIKELREKTGLTQKAFSEWLGIPKRTIEDWEGGRRTPPEYVVELIAFRVEHENDVKAAVEEFAESLKDRLEEECEQVQEEHSYSRYYGYKREECLAMINQHRIDFITKN